MMIDGILGGLHCVFQIPSSLLQAVIGLAGAGILCLWDEIKTNLFKFCQPTSKTIIRLLKLLLPYRCMLQLSLFFLYSLFTFKVCNFDGQAVLQSFNSFYFLFKMEICLSVDATEAVVTCFAFFPMVVSSCGGLLNFFCFTFFYWCGLLRFCFLLESAWTLFFSVVI